MTATTVTANVPQGALQTSTSTVATTAAPSIDTGQVLFMTGAKLFRSSPLSSLLPLLRTHHTSYAMEIIASDLAPDEVRRCLHFVFEVLTRHNPASRVRPARVEISYKQGRRSSGASMGHPQGRLLRVNAYLRGHCFSGGPEFDEDDTVHTCNNFGPLLRTLVSGIGPDEDVTAGNLRQQLVLVADKHQSGPQLSVVHPAKVGCGQPGCTPDGFEVESQDVQLVVPAR